MAKTRIADDTNAIGARLQELQGQRQDMVGGSTCPKVGYFFEVLEKKHRGMSGRFLFFHPEIGGAETMSGSVCEQCNPTKCNCAEDVASDNDIDVADFGYPDVYFCPDCP
jgi:hypothetical protein